MNITYLVDLENIGTKPLCQYVVNHQEGEYIVFYSDNTSMPGTVLEELPDTISISFISCKTGGNNAMDFCICAMAGNLSAYKTRKIKILSNDKGYDTMIRMLQDQGTRITRECVTYNPEQEETPASDINNSNRFDIEDVIRKHVPKKYQNEMMKAIPNVINRKEAHEMCQIILPKNLATDIYRKLRRYIPREVI